MGLDPAIHSKRVTKGVWWLEEGEAPIAIGLIRAQIRSIFIVKLLNIFLKKQIFGDGVKVKVNIFQVSSYCGRYHPQTNIKTIYILENGFFDTSLLRLINYAL